MIFRGEYAIIQERKMITVDENRNSNISSEHSEELLNIIENFRLMDDTFMSKVFEDKACAELLLRVILNRDDLTVVRVVSQFELKNLQGRSARLDIYAIDEHGKQYDVEVQRSDDSAARRGSERLRGARRRSPARSVPCWGTIAAIGLTARFGGCFPERA